jgi:DNA-binding NarL/FixJ family response regulator
MYQSWPGETPPDEAAPRLRAIVADDDPLACSTIKDSLRRAGIVVVAEAHNGREAFELCLYYRPDVVVMDVVMPELDGIAATRRIIEEMPHQIIVILTSSSEDELGVVGLIAGASGFLSKDVDIEMLPREIEAACNGEAAISRRLGMCLIHQLRRTPVSASGMRPVKSPLTPREWEVVDLLCQGASTDAIAGTLVLSTETVRSHIKHVLRKLDARSRGEAVEIVQAMRGDTAGA